MYISKISNDQSHYVKQRRRVDWTGWTFAPFAVRIHWTPPPPPASHIIRYPPRKCEGYKCRVTQGSIDRGQTTISNLKPSQFRPSRISCLYRGVGLFVLLVTSSTSYRQYGLRRIIDVAISKRVMFSFALAEKLRISCGSILGLSGRMRENNLSRNDKYYY